MKRNTLLQVLGLLLFLMLTACGNDNMLVAEGIGDRLLSRTVPPRQPVKAADIVLEKQLLYDQHTLDDRYPYKDTMREFQWDKIRQSLAHIENEQRENRRWAILRNRGNMNGLAPLVKEYTRNEYNNIRDKYDVERYQSVPLYTDPSDEPERYGRDGMLVELIDRPDSSEFVKVRTVFFDGEWYLPEKFVKAIDTESFGKAVFVDRTNQNIASLDKSGDKWLIRSMNPATTGVKRPPYAHETPLGIFVFQEKKEKMIFLKDGTTETGGFAPWASRFCNGAYIHGVPTNVPATGIIEYSQTLGTIPRSHMCVRNATSHAKFIYDWGPIEQTLVVIIE